jgi:hypothetical protein
MLMPAFTIHAIARSRTNFAIQHLQAAKRAALSAYEVEQVRATAEFGSWFDEMLIWVPVSVVMAAAALEAHANELIQNILDDASTKCSGLLLTDRKKLKNIKACKSGNTTDKYNQLAKLFNKKPEVGRSPWQNAYYLVIFRNHFMHFKPSWDDDNIHNDDLVKWLRPKIPIIAAYKDKFLFPYGYMTYGCAKWAVETVLKFSTDFTKLLGVKDTFALSGRDFRLP